MELRDIATLVNDKDGSKRVHITLYDMYLRDSADCPPAAEFAEKFEQQLNDRGVDSSVAEEFVKLIGDELALEGGEFKEHPEEFAREFIQKEGWTPFTEVDGFHQYVVSGQFFLPDKTTKVYLHTGYPGQGVYYDDQQKLYRLGVPYVAFVEVDGFQKDMASNQFFLPDKATKVYPHTGYPDQAIYYDEQQRLYQHGKQYEPATTTEGTVATAATEETVNLATDTEIAELLDSPSNYEELQQAVAAGDLVIEYDDEDLDSFSAQQFVNID
jgi:hypothetical protein